MPYFVTVDIGGTVIKSGLYDELGREKAVASQTDLAIVKHVGWSERDMIAMWRTVAPRCARFWRPAKSRRARWRG